MTLADNLATRSQNLGQLVISNLSQWYENGVFYQQDMTNYHRNGLPHAALMATLARYTTSATLKAAYIKMISEIVEFSIATNMNAAQNYYGDGGLDPYGFYGQFPDQQAMNLNFVYGATTTIEQISNIGWILWQLPDGAISSSTRARWTKVVQDTCTQLDARPSNSITTYYINGNYQCQLLGCYWFAALASRGAKRLYFQDCYERAYNFLLKPGLSSATWTGWGLTIDVTGTQPDWADYQVHLTETNTRTVGGAGWDLDWNYSTVQMDALARVFTANRDTRLIRLVNGISTKIEPRVNTSTWLLDGTGGSRQNGPYAMFGSSWHIQALIGAKGTNRTLLSDANILSMWDTANGMNNTVLANSLNGLFTAPVDHQLSLGIAPVRYAAALAGAIVPAV